MGTIRSTCLFYLCLLWLTAVRSATEECVDLVPTIVDSCPAFAFAKSNDLSLDVDEPLVKAQGGGPRVQAFDKIMAQSFDKKCCDLMQKLNTSRCFCQEDVVKALESDMEEELLAFTIFTAARPLPSGCGGSIWAALDSDQCLPLGPKSDAAGDGGVTSRCKALSSLLRDPRTIQQSVNLFEEALDATGLLSKVEDLDAVTIFAPTDSAFTNFAEDQGITVSQLLANSEVLETVLMQHVIGNNIIKMADVKSTSQFTTLEGRDLAVKALPSGGFAVEGIPVSQADIAICNGVMHTVPTVLVGTLDIDPEAAAAAAKTPPRVSSNTANATIKGSDIAKDTLAKEKDCKSLLKLLVSFEEAFGVLIDEIDKVDDVKAALESNGPWTIFAPINSALEIEKVMNGTKSVEDSRKTLQRLIVEGDFEASSLEPGTKLTTIGGEQIEATVEGGTIQINGVKVVQADIEACNGRLFIIEGPLPPLADAASESAGKTKTGTGVKKPVKPVTVQKKPSKMRKVGTQPATAPSPKKEGSKRPAVPPSALAEGEVVSVPKTNFTTPGREVTPKKPVVKKVEAKKPTTGVTSVPKSIEADATDACSCSITGVTAGIESGRRGCGQHILDFGEAKLFCYIENPETCEESNEGIEMFPSQKFAPGAWRECEKAEVSELPTLAELLGTKLESLHPVWRLFSHASLDDLLQDEGPFTVFVPSRLAVANLLSSGKLDGDSANAEQLQAILQNHIIKGRLTKQDLSSKDTVTTLGGAELRIRSDETGSLLIGATASVELADMLASNGVAHIVDELISEDATQERTVSLAKACSCSLDDFSGDVYTGRPRCDIHIPGEAPFCYVQHPDECHLATESKAFVGAKWMPCSDPCSCTKDGVSGTVNTDRVGCARHVIGHPPFCYVVDPDQCQRSSPSEAYEGAGWKYCDTFPEWPFLTFGRQGAVAEDPCACSEDGVSGGVITGRPGCGRFGVVIAPFRTCYVKNPSSCPISLPSIRSPGAGWRIC